MQSPIETISQHIFVYLAFAIAISVVGVAAAMIVDYFGALNTVVGAATIGWLWGATMGTRNVLQQRRIR